MRLYRMDRARALMGLGAIDQETHTQLYEIGARIFDNINEAAGILLGSQVSASATEALFAESQRITAELDAMNATITSGQADDTIAILREASALEERSKELVRESREAARTLGTQYRTSYALALGFTITAAVVGAVWITAKAGA